MRHLIATGWIGRPRADMPVAEGHREVAIAGIEPGVREVWGRTYLAHGLPQVATSWAMSTLAHDVAKELGEEWPRDPDDIAHSIEEQRHAALRYAEGGSPERSL